MNRIVREAEGAAQVVDRERRRSDTVARFVHDYGWVHLSLALVGNVSFFVGSILFLPAFEPVKTLGVWLFIIGAFGMLLGSVGNVLVWLLPEE